jgi:hypothetical protein
MRLQLFDLFNRSIQAIEFGHLVAVSNFLFLVMGNDMFIKEINDVSLYPDDLFPVLFKRLK